MSKKNKINSGTKNIVIFLGAGASKAFNYPLTKEILPLIINAIKEGKLFKSFDVSKEIDNLYLSLIKNLICTLSPGIKPMFEKNKKLNSNEELPLITDLLSQAENILNRGFAINDFNFEGDSPTSKIESINQRWSLKEVIRILEMAIIVTIDKQGKDNNNSINEFIEWIKNTNENTNTFLSIVTSNYDSSIEWNLLDYGEANYAHEMIDYGFNWRDVNDGTINQIPEKPKFRIYKLHGSTDWLNCARCGHIYVNTTSKIFELTFSNKKEPKNYCHCDYWPLSPVLVSPSYSRNVNDTNLSQIWRNSLELLRKADEWIIIGYSLPGEDFDIKSLFIRALAGRKKKPTIKVIQKTDSSEIKYDHFFGEGNYEFSKGGLEEYDLSKIKII